MTSRTRLIYPDTIIWNLLCDQKVDPRKLLDALNSKGYTLVENFHAIYELARTFEHDDAKGNARGQQLFEYVKSYLDLSIPSTKQLWELIVAEAYAMECHFPAIDPMSTAEQRATVEQGVAELANARIGSEVTAFLEGWQQFAEGTQKDQKAHIELNEDLKQYLEGISESGLSSWMAQETQTDSAASTLHRWFVKKVKPVAPEYIIELLRLPFSDASKGLVRANLYSNWHCAKYGVNRLDLTPDMLHVLQAIYCDLYVTEDKKQAKFAGLLLTPRTPVRIYPDRSVPIDQWLLSLL